MADTMASMEDINEKAIVITNLSFARGTDLKFMNTSYVVCDFVPVSWGQLYQALGRSNRTQEGESKGCLIARADT